MKNLLCTALFLFLYACGSGPSDATSYIGIIIAGGGVSRPSYSTGVGFYVVNDQGNHACSAAHPCKLYDANGIAFVPYGTNELHYDVGAFNDGAYLTGATAMRMNVVMSSTTTYNADIMQSRAIDHQIVPIPATGWGSTTCDSSTSTLNGAVSNWVTYASVFKPFERYMLVNIANEWGPGDTNDNAHGGAGTDTNGAAWAAAYETAITNMRNAGYLGTLMIDVGECGKSYSDIIDQGQNLMDYDPQHNLMFSVHEYDYTAQPGTQPTWLAALNATGLPYVIGEFGVTGLYGSNTTPLQNMMNATDAGVGWLNWAWDDNNGANCTSSGTSYAMVNRSSCSTTWDGTNAMLTAYGSTVVFDSTYGLSGTGTPANGTSRYPRATIFP